MKLFVEYEIDWELLVRELLKGIRGKRSQKDVDHALNFNHDQVYRWESNSVQIAWDDFIRFCKVCDVDPSFEFKSKTKKVPTNEVEDFSGIIKTIMGPTAQVQFCKQVGVSRAMLNKWIQKKSVPSLIQMLKIVHYGAGWMIAFCEQCTDPTDFKSIGKLYKMQTVRSAIVEKYPITYLIMMVLYTKQFEQLEKYENGYFAEMFDISKDVEKEIMDALIESGMIVPWQGVYAVIECSDFIHINQATEEVYQNKITTLNEYAMNKMKQKGPFHHSNLFYSLMCCMTKRQKKEVENVVQETYRKILNIMTDIDDQNEIIDDAILVNLGIVSYVKEELDEELDTES